VPSAAISHFLSRDIRLQARLGAQDKPLHYCFTITIGYTTKRELLAKTQIYVDPSSDNWMHDAGKEVHALLTNVDRRIIGSDTHLAQVRSRVTTWMMETVLDLGPKRIVLRRKVVVAPGVTLNRVTQFLLTREAHRRYVAPVIADMQEEYCEALAAGRKQHGRWIAVRGHLLVIPGWLYGALVRAVKQLFSAP
jgi:hypothetical protein